MFGDSGEEEKIERQTLVPGVEPGPSDWESSAPNGAKNDVLGRRKMLRSYAHVWVMQCCKLSHVSPTIALPHNYLSQLVGTLDTQLILLESIGRRKLSKFGGANQALTIEATPLRA